MSNLTVSGIFGTYTYSTSNLYSYLGAVPQTGTELKEAFEDYGITPEGGVEDLRKLNKALYSEYSKQVQTQIENQNKEAVVPWASVCEQIGVPVTGDKDKDYAAFQTAIDLLSQGIYDGQAQTYFAGLKTEAQSAFGQNVLLSNQAPYSYSQYISHYDW